MIESHETKGAVWDLTSYFPEYNGSEMQSFWKVLEREIAAYQDKSRNLDDLNHDNLADWEDVVLKSEDLMARLIHLASYIHCLASADARNEDFQKHEGMLSLLGAEFAKLEVELLRALKPATDEVFEAFAAREALVEARHTLNQMRDEARYTMSRDKEVLSAELGVDGISGWGRLYDTISGKLEFEMKYPDGRVERLPIAQRRSLLDDPNREVRRAAFEGGNEAWETVEDTAAAALNHIAGTRLTLNRHRGRDHFLDVALFQSQITREALDAMFEAVMGNADLSRRILKLKANMMGRDTLAWYDLGAPLPLKDQERLSWEEGKQITRQAFEEAYGGLAQYLQLAIDSGWIESELRPAKRPGAYCTHSPVSKEARVFMTFNGSLNDVRTLAHEIGHAFHSHLLRDMRPFAQEYPMTLAEAASTFAEMILAEGIVGNESISAAQRALMLESEVGESAIFLLDIPVRFQFEKALYEERAKGELSVSRLKELMIETQQRVLGEVLAEDGVDPMFWASKLHFYITGVTFYNFPYTFGYLLSRGLFARFQKEGVDFLPKYEDFLRLTGSDNAVNVARRSIGVDLEQTDFWVESIRSMEQPLAQLESVLPEVLPDYS